MPSQAELRALMKNKMSEGLKRKGGPIDIKALKRQRKLQKEKQEKAKQKTAMMPPPPKAKPNMMLPPKRFDAGGKSLPVKMLGPKDLKPRIAPVPAPKPKPKPVAAPTPAPVSLVAYGDASDSDEEETTSVCLPTSLSFVHLCFLVVVAQLAIAKLQRQQLKSR